MKRIIHTDLIQGAIVGDFLPAYDDRVWVTCTDRNCPSVVFGEHEHEGGIANRELDGLGEN